MDVEKLTIKSRSLRCTLGNTLLWNSINWNERNLWSFHLMNWWWTDDELMHRMNTLTIRALWIWIPIQRSEHICEICERIVHGFVVVWLSIYERRSDSWCIKESRFARCESNELIRNHCAQNINFRNFGSGKPFIMILWSLIEALRAFQF